MGRTATSNHIHPIKTRPGCYEIRKTINGHRYQKYFTHLPSEEEVNDTIQHFISVDADKMAKLDRVSEAIFLGTARVSVQKLPSGHYRLQKHIGGNRYSKTIRYKPTAREAAKEIAKLIEKRKNHKPWSKAKVKQKSFVYFIENVETHKIKIGFSTDIDTRMRDLRTACGSELVLLGLKEYGFRNDAFAFESDMHQRFSNHRIYVNGSSTEWFSGRIKRSVLKILEATA